MIHWRESLFRLKNEIRRAKANGHSTISIQSLEAVISEIEDDIQIDNDIEILEKLNKTPKSEGYDSYSASLDKYAEYVKTENEHHRQYTQLVITAGYAAFFGIWALIEKKSTVLDASLILMTISVISFVMLEVAKVGLYGYDIHTKNKALLKAKAEDDVHKKQNEASMANSFETYRELWMSRFWTWTYPISVITGVFALLMVLWALISGLSIFN